MERLYMDKQGRVTIPARLRQQLGMGDETPLFAEIGEDGLLLRPATHPMAGVDPADQAEFVISGATLDPTERRRILHSLAG